MSREDYLEPEWPEEIREETEKEDPESDRGLYSQDTPPEEEKEAEKPSREEPDSLNGADSVFLILDEHRMYKLREPPKLMPNTTWYGMAEACFQTYFKKHDLFYYHGFLHYYEPILNEIVSGFVLRYAMIGHFSDLKQEAVLGLLEAEQHYDPEKGKRFLQYSKVYMKNRMHYYIRKMRRGCTVTTAYTDKKLRTIMRKFYDHGGRNDLETICKVAEEMKIPQEEAAEIIQCALLNTLCTGIYRQVGSADGEWEKSSEERTVSPYPEPYEALLQQYQTEALLAAWNSLNYREQEMLAAHLGFCPECFGVFERKSPDTDGVALLCRPPFQANRRENRLAKESGCRPVALQPAVLRKRTPYADLAVDFGLSSPESAQRICEAALVKLRTEYCAEYDRKLNPFASG